MPSHKIISISIHFKNNFHIILSKLTTSGRTWIFFFFLHFLILEWIHMAQSLIGRVGKLWPSGQINCL